MVYSLSAGDVRFFTIHPTSGQIMVGADTELDYETKKSYRVTVKAVDPSGASGTIAITINVTDVDEVADADQEGAGGGGARKRQLPGERQEHGGGVLGVGAECRQRELEADRARRLRLLHEQPWGADLQVDAELRGAGGLRQGQQVRTDDHGAFRQGVRTSST